MTYAPIKDFTVLSKVIETNGLIDYYTFKLANKITLTDSRHVIHANKYDYTQIIVYHIFHVKKIVLEYTNNDCSRTAQISREKTINRPLK